MATIISKRQALGQIVALGSLYDARKDQILSQSVFSEPLSADATNSAKVPSKECIIDKSGSLSAMFRQLGLSSELGLSFLTGTGPYTTKGSAGHLTQKKLNTAMQDVSIVCTEVTKHDTLDLDNEELLGLVDDEALETEEATHVIIGIWWGARTVVSCNSSLAGLLTNGNTKEAKPSAEERVIEHIGQLLTGKVATDDATFKEMSKDMSFRVNADIDPEKQTAQISDFDAVCQFVSKLPTAIKKAKAGKGTCITYDLIPIKDFAQRVNKDLGQEAKTVKPVIQEYQERILFLFEKLYATKLSLNNYFQTLSQHALSVPKQHIENTQQDIFQLNDLEDSLKSELYQDLPRARDPDFDGSLKLNNPEWIDRIEKYESLVSRYATKMAFESEVTKLAIKYIQPPEVEGACSKNKGDIYIFYYSDAATITPVWKDQHDKFMEIAHTKGNKQLILVVDCDFEGGQQLGGPRIELRQNGKIMTPDFVVEQQGLVGKCLVRPATPADLNKLPDQSRDSIRRNVKIPCPCPAGKTNECICSTCKETIFFLADDRYMYCNCGRYRPANAVFKCLDPAHGSDYIKYKDPDELLTILNNLKEFEQYNILILGETGVGKSTFINGFMNYMLFKTLDEALEAPGLRWAIASSFKYTELINKKMETFTVSVGTETTAEKYSLEGQSATQSCVTYVLHMDGLTLRLIDTPGIGDTRGLQQDKDNVKDIIRTLKSVDKLSTILFLMKPNSARLGQVFNFCMTELLSQLHKETNKNIVFGFTNARSTNYSLGDTGTPLQKLLNDKKTDITVDYDNTFFFDSESFRYLAAYKVINKAMKDKSNYDESFQKSAEEARRLVNRTIGMTMHEVRKTLSLSDTRLYIEGLKNPMILINKLADEDQTELEKQKSYIQKFGVSNSALEDKLKITVRKPIKTMLPSPRTVCADEACKTVDGDEKGEKYAVYKQICHDNCGINTNNEQIGVAELSECWAFDCAAKPCRICGHEWMKHLHISYNLTVEHTKVDNTAILEIYNSNKSESEKASAAIKSLEEKAKILKDRKDFINHSLASFGAYLGSIAMVKYNDATIKYLDYLVDNAKKEGKADDQRRFEEQRRAYEEQLEKITKGDAELNIPPTVPSDADIADIIGRLDKMEVNGSKIKDLLGEQKDNTPPPHSAVTLPLETAGKGSKFFSWIERLKERFSG
ncbi:dna cytosine-5--methyltransferase [Trichoderma arundinaceum]|uniref:Dna cytosine-5--methyltransferase n=1 Tax=Trichoderma arundinaceum TaxID=490622 RepID=A0A395NU39_TRIAR|nr:dna cytosine-5--methyltransferase [Trichoderma arundinaceum]